VSAPGSTTSNTPSRSQPPLGPGESQPPSPSGRPPPPADAHGAFAQPAQRAGRKHAARVEHHDAATDPLHELELVAGEQNRHARRGLGSHDLRQRIDRLRGPTSERLVQHEHPRSMSESDHKLNPLLVATRELHQPLACASAETEPIEPSAPSATSSVRVEAVQAREIAHQGRQAHLRIEPTFLGHASEPLPIGVTDGVATPGHRTAIRPQDPHHRAHRRRLAGAIATHQPHNLTGCDRERHRRARPGRRSDDEDSIPRASFPTITPQPSPPQPGRWLQVYISNQRPSISSNQPSVFSLPTVAEKPVATGYGASIRNHPTSEEPIASVSNSRACYPPLRLPNSTEEGEWKPQMSRLG
jgi:hypothetical protein